MKPPDLEGARIWYTRAAEAGDAEAQLQLRVLADEPGQPDLAEARTQ